MSVLDLVQAGRTLAESLMTDTCTIRRTTAPMTGPAGVITGGGTPEVVYTGQCRIQVRGLVARDVDSADQQVVINSAELQLPVVGSEGLAVDDVATIDTCPADPDMVGRTWRVQELFNKSHATARRLGVRSV